MRHSLVFVVIAGLSIACTGPRGSTGPQGPTGMTGAQGPAGMTGSQGQRGMKGSQGQSVVTEVEVQPGSVVSWVSLRDIMFEYDSADVRPSEMSKIVDVAAYVNKNPSVRIGLDGSTDLLPGTNRYNVDLNQQRVANVRDALVQTGVSANRIETGDFGAQRIECNDSSERCSQRDGRVEVLAYSTDR